MNLIGESISIITVLSHWIIPVVESCWTITRKVPLAVHRKHFSNQNPTGNLAMQLQLLQFWFWMDFGIDIYPSPSFDPFKGFQRYQPFQTPRPSVISRWSALHILLAWNIWAIAVWKKTFDRLEFWYHFQTCGAAPYVLLVHNPVQLWYVSYTIAIINSL